jgi:hypothetical protein
MTANASTCTPAQTVTQTGKQRVAEFLKERFIKPDCTLYTVLRHVTPDGLSRFFDVYVVKDNEPYRITRSVSEITGFTYHKKREAIRVRGYGFCAETEIAHAIGRALFGNGELINAKRI